MAEVRQVCTSGVVAGAGSQAGEQAGQRFVAIKRLQVMLEEVLGGDEAGEIVPAGEGFLALHQALQALVRLVGQQVEALRTQVLPSGFRGQGIHREFLSRDGTHWADIVCPGSITILNYIRY